VVGLATIGDINKKAKLKIKYRQGENHTAMLLLVMLLPLKSKLIIKLSLLIKC
jgi:hypothetical protein